MEVSKAGALYAYPEAALTAGKSRSISRTIFQRSGSRARGAVCGSEIPKGWDGAIHPEGGPAPPIRASWKALSFEVRIAACLVARVLANYAQTSFSACGYRHSMRLWNPLLALRTKGHRRYASPWRSPGRLAA